MGTVVPLATAPRGMGDVEAARVPLRAAAGAGVAHLLLISIVGIERIPMRYYPPYGRRAFADHLAERSA